MTQKRWKCGELYICGFKNPNFAQFLNIFARPHGRTVTAFRNSGSDTASTIPRASPVEVDIPRQGIHPNNNDKWHPKYRASPDFGWTSWKWTIWRSEICFLTRWTNEKYWNSDGLLKSCKFRLIQLKKIIEEAWASPTYLVAGPEPAIDVLGEEIRSVTAIEVTETTGRPEVRNRSWVSRWWWW